MRSTGRKPDGNLPWALSARSATAMVLPKDTTVLLCCGLIGSDADGDATGRDGGIPARRQGCDVAIVGDDLVGGEQIEDRLRGDVVEVALFLIGPADRDPDLDAAGDALRAAASRAPSRPP